MMTNALLNEPFQATERPENIQPYYLAWMFANPDLPRAWQTDKWSSNGCNVPYMHWIGDKHKEFKSILGYVDSYQPYSDRDEDAFVIWLFDQVGIDENIPESMIE